MTFPMTIASQDEFDEKVRDRLTRQREQFEGKITELEGKVAGLGDLTTRAEQAEAAKATAEQERDAAAQRATDAEAKVGTFEQKEQLATWRADVAKATGVPAGALRGSTKEELEAHATELKPLLTAAGSPVIPSQGDSPDTSNVESEERAAVRSLFGGGSDD
ncbi:MULTISPECIES: hypothetical protein [unclassified Agrococcus]|uniref:hypothetical protein n=1 Tax=unclassified Agrococcus TaxID=2615065 RepID=UPI003615A979